MSDYGDDSEGLYDEDGWLYVAEEDHLADDLAEHAIASPPPQSTEEDDYNSDYFEYWIDIEYNSDGYHDVESRPSKKEKKRDEEIKVSGQSSAKRKRNTRDGPPQKKRKAADGSHITRALSPTPTVIWQSRKSRLAHDKTTSEGASLSTEPQETFALLKDWRTQFDHPTSPAKPSKPTQKPPQPTPAEPEPQPEIPAIPDSPIVDGPAAADDNGNDDDLTSLISRSGLDPAALMRALTENLAAAGAGAAPAGLDQGTLLRYALRMLGGGEDEAEDIAGELADEVFEDREGEGEEGAEGEWEDEEEASEDAEEDTATEQPSLVPNGLRASSSRSSNVNSNHAPPTAGHPPNSVSRKRKAASPPVAAEDEELLASRPKRAHRSCEKPGTTAAATRRARPGKGKKGG